ncbi:MAG: hypothetical protein V5A27_07625 [Halapricum sp.]
MATTDSPGETPPVDDAREELQAAVPEAAATLRGLLEAEDERIQLRAAEAILDRAGVTKAKKLSTRAAARDVGGEEDELSDLF